MRREKRLLFIFGFLLFFCGFDAHADYSYAQLHQITESILEGQFGISKESSDLQSRLADELMADHEYVRLLKQDIEDEHYVVYEKEGKFTGAKNKLIPAEVETRLQIVMKNEIGILKAQVKIAGEGLKDPVHPEKNIAPDLKRELSYAIELTEMAKFVEAAVTEHGHSNLFNNDDLSEMRRLARNIATHAFLFSPKTYAGFNNLRPLNFINDDALFEAFKLFAGDSKLQEKFRQVVRESKNPLNPVVSNELTGLATQIAELKAKEMYPFADALLIMLEENPKGWGLADQANGFSAFVDKVYKKAITFDGLNTSVDLRPRFESAIAKLGNLRDRLSARMIFLRIPEAAQGDLTKFAVKMGVRNPAEASVQESSLSVVTQELRASPQFRAALERGISDPLVSDFMSLTAVTLKRQQQLGEMGTVFPDVGIECFNLLRKLNPEVADRFQDTFLKKEFLISNLKPETQTDATELFEFFMNQNHSVEKQWLVNRILVQNFNAYPDFIQNNILSHSQADPLLRSKLIFDGKINAPSEYQNAVHDYLLWLTRENGAGAIAYLSQNPTLIDQLAMIDFAKAFKNPDEEFRVLTKLTENEDHIFANEAPVFRYANPKMVLRLSNLFQSLFYQMSAFELKWNEIENLMATHLRFLDVATKKLSAQEVEKLQISDEKRKFLDWVEVNMVHEDHAKKVEIEKIINDSQDEASMLIIKGACDINEMHITHPN